MIRRLIASTAAFGLLAALVIGTGPASAQAKKVVVATPGIPPIFSVMIVYIADKQGIFKKYGIDIEIRPFDNGTAAARAVVAGDADISWSPTPPVINQISNAGVPLVAVYGMPNPDWVIGTTEAGKTCEDIKGQEVGVDSVGGARSVALRSMLRVCKGVTIEDTKQVALGGGAGAAMIESARFINDPKNIDVVAEACMITGHSKEIAKAAVQQYITAKFWATNDDGLPRDKLEATAALMKKIGAITADKQPVTYDNLVDTSVWKDANAMVK